MPRISLVYNIDYKYERVLIFAYTRTKEKKININEKSLLKFLYYLL